MPAGQVSKLQNRIITQPNAIKGRSREAELSAPKVPLQRHPFPVMSFPSASTLILERKLFSNNVCCVSASPNSHGSPACRSDVRERRPYLHRIRKSTPHPPRFATPAAIVPTPTSETSFTEILAGGLAHFKSWISSAKSSIE
jgi:hypothetical protein